MFYASYWKYGIVNVHCNKDSVRRVWFSLLLLVLMMSVLLQMVSVIQYGNVYSLLAQVLSHLLALAQGKDQ
jgi:hypothetical protein